VSGTGLDGESLVSRARRGKASSPPTDMRKDPHALAETTDTTPAPETSDDEVLFAKARAAMDEARPLNEAAEAKASEAVRFEITRNAKMLRALSIAACKGALEYAATGGAIELFNWAAIDAFADLLWIVGRVSEIEEDAKGCWSAALALLHEHEGEIVATQRTPDGWARQVMEQTALRVVQRLDRAALEDADVLRLQQERFEQNAPRRKAAEVALTAKWLSAEAAEALAT